MAEDLVGKVFSIFSGDKNLSDKEIVLQQRHKELGENKYARFFRPKSDEADIAMAGFFFSLLKMVSPLRTFLRDTSKMHQLRQIVMEAFIDLPIVETVKRLHPQSIEMRSKSMAPDDLIAEIRSDMQALASGFNESRINGVNRCHNMILLIFQLVNFDYPGLLRKFDPTFTEGTFSGTPKFSSVKIELIARELSDFLAVASGITPESDWKTLLKLLKICSGEELISESQFAQMVVGLQDVISSKILLLMVQYGIKNPVWICKPRIPDEHIAEQWIEAKTLKAQACIDMINSKDKQQKVDELVKEIFDSDDLVRLENYVVDRAQMYQNRDFPEFTYAEGLNYLSSFLSDYVDKGIHDLCDLLLIRGQWTSNASSKEMSEALHQILGLAAQVAGLDEELSVDGASGSRLKAAIIRVDRDPTQTRHINTMIENVNESARDILEQAVAQFSILSKHIKALQEDVLKKHPEQLVNWRELTAVSKDNPLSSQLAQAQTRLSGFVRLMQSCSQ
ncbi:MAG: DUF5312 family protein [Treponema sp.]|nr:DUF5312 family protein [Treponema sp.]